MVVSVKPGKFYGSSLPRPRYYTDIKFSDERVNPPLPVLDPLMSWAEEAHWSMGGLSFNRLRLQGKIEGNVKKLKKEREVTWNKKMESFTPKSKLGVGVRGRKVGGSGGESPPPAPILKKRRQKEILDVLDNEEEFDDEYDSGEEEIESDAEKNGGMQRKRRRLVRKLGDDFEFVGVESGKNGKSPLKDSNNDGVPNGIAARTRTRVRGRRMMVLKDDEEEGDGDDETNQTMSKDNKNGFGNGKIEKIKKKSVSVTPKKNKAKSSVSPSGFRSSPRLKQKSS